LADSQTVLSADCDLSRYCVPISTMDALRSFLAAPRVPEAAKLSRWDWVLFVSFLVVGVADLHGGGYVSSRPVAVGLAAVLSLAVLWRRARSLVAVLVAFTAVNAVQIAQLELREHEAGLSVLVILIILAYSLVRWGSGREVAIGLGLILVHTAVSEATEWEGSVVDYLEGVSLGALLWASASAPAVMSRHRSEASEGRVAQARVEERRELARELHDTVAHHVSAIAIQAQAARVVAPSQPGAADDALLVIEQIASRTLAEMRKIVGALRDAGTTPQRNLTDVERLARRGNGGPRVEVSLAGNLEALDASVEMGLYRIAQESITNARRHAREVSRVSVLVDGTDDAVCVTVQDDGKSSPNGPTPSHGYGLTGLKERAALLGGTFEAGPGPHGGWLVRAVFPKARGA